jgi:hypothetical protein
MNLTHRGKIGRLPAGVQEELNRRMANGERGGRLAVWLNSLPEVQAVVAAEFAGKPVREQNLSQWRQHGYKKWLWRQEAQAMVAETGAWQAPGAPPLTDQMATWASVHYLTAVRKLTEMKNAGKPDVKVLREFCRDVVALRRGEQGGARLKLQQERRECKPAKTAEQNLPQTNSST